MELLQEKVPFKPKIRRAKTSAHILISLPSNSVGFFVLPGARMQVCIENEKERDLLLEEIENDQSIPLPEELEFMVGSRSAFARNSLLDEITQHLKEEMIADERFYKSEVIKSRKHEDMEDESEFTVEEKITDKSRKFLIDRAKQKTFRDFEKRRDVLKKFLLERTKNIKYDTKIDQDLQPEIVDNESSVNFRELKKSSKYPSKETVSLTTQMNSVFTDEELNKLITEASNKFTKPNIKRDINMQLLELMGDTDSSFENNNVDKKISTPTKIHARKPRDINGRRSELKEKLEEAKQRIADRRHERLQNIQSKKDTISKLRVKGYKGGQRFKRDINMDLLKVKAEGAKKNIKNPQKGENGKKAVKKLTEKEATLRKPGQTSDELFEDIEFVDPEEGDNNVQPKQTEVFAELADPDYDQSYEMIDTIKPKKNGLFDRKQKTDPFGTELFSFDISDSDKRKKKKGKGRKMSKSEDNLQFLTSSEEFTDIEEDFPCIHEYYGKGSGPVDRQWEKVVFELGEFSSDERKQRKDKQMMKKKESVSLHF